MFGIQSARQSFYEIHVERMGRRHTPTVKQPNPGARTVWVQKGFEPCESGIAANRIGPGGIRIDDRGTLMLADDVKGVSWCRHTRVNSSSDSIVAP